MMDGIEMSINSFLEGFKYNVAITTDHDQTLYRNKAFTAVADKIFTQEEAPHIIKILDNAKDVEERKLIEAVYGVDLSNVNDRH